MDAKRIPFSPEDEERIASAGVWGVIVAITSMASTLLSVVASTIQVATASRAAGALTGAAMSGIRSAAIGTTVVVGLIQLTLVIILGIWLLQASLAFRKVALTDEADQHYLLVGFGKLRNYFMMMGILLIIGVCGAALLFCGALTCGAMFAPH